jgi:hypothetical protein
LHWLERHCSITALYHTLSQLYHPSSTALLYFTKTLQIFANYHECLLLVCRSFAVLSVPSPVLTPLRISVLTPPADTSAYVSAGVWLVLVRHLQVGDQQQLGPIINEQLIATGLSSAIPRVINETLQCLICTTSWSSLHCVACVAGI